MVNWKKPKTYAVKHKNNSIREASRSGGVFTALSDEVLKNKGVVYGCILTQDFLAVHIRAKDAKTRDLMRGSKYIQSKLGDTYKTVQQDLKNGIKVMFTGTSCQVAGLREFLGQDYENLLCVDIVCHGVASPVVWKEYLIWQEKENSSKIKLVNFRNKKDFGWHNHIETLLMTNGIVVNSKVFATLFYNNSILRPSCYECPYTNIIHPGDITIADYWGIERAVPRFDDNKGVSLVLINNEKGEVAFEKAKNVLVYRNTRIENSLQKPLLKPQDKSKEREQFWLDFKNRNFNQIVKKYAGIDRKVKFNNKLKLIRQKIRNLIRK